MKQYNVKMCSQLLNVSEEQVRRLIRTGKLKAIKKSNKEGYKINESDLIAYKYNRKNYSPTLSDVLIQSNDTGYNLGKLLYKDALRKMIRERDNLNKAIEVLETLLEEESQ